MTPTVAIVEPYRDLAEPLQEVVALAHCTPVTVASLEELAELTGVPAAIIIRVVASSLSPSLDKGLEQLRAEGNPKVVALTSSDADAEEAERIGCDLVLRQPQQVRALYDALTGLSAAT